MMMQLLAPNTAVLVLAVCAEQHILCGTVVVARGLDMAGTVAYAGLYLTEVAWVANDGCQLARHGV